MGAAVGRVVQERLLVRARRKELVLDSAHRWDLQATQAPSQRSPAPAPAPQLMVRSFNSSGLCVISGVKSIKSIQQALIDELGLDVESCCSLSVFVEALSLYPKAVDLVWENSSASALCMGAADFATLVTHFRSIERLRNDFILSLL
eukprot:m.17027 g.17027  ORF g.17027 m.17027 type:complete len:147 (+) comp28769_c0_seq1:134-574(+)